MSATEDGLLKELGDLRTELCTMDERRHRIQRRIRILLTKITNNHRNPNIEIGDSGFQVTFKPCITRVQP